ncbi:DUF1573 domain-containing protein [Candidatus Bipolaricaulota bacterium]
MNRVCVATVFMAVLIGFAANAAPQISVDRSAYDFGLAMEGTVVRHVFVITNTGDETLEILRVRTGCGCTTAALATTTLAPGESVDLVIMFNSAGYGGRTMSKTIYVESSDPMSPRTSIRITVEVVRLGPNQIAQADLSSILYVMIDLRSPEEYAEGHVLGAINIPFALLDQYVGRLPTSQLMIVYDADGALSDQAVDVLIENGYRDAKSLFGGFAMWVETQGSAMIWPMQE